ncbi:SDR family oxidoreductase [Paraconexibacter algicola]|uniref:Peroxisomal trans-2-enoyl-CoA reductase n=1 Tax=Paraconexibacter algicola TaxID=2133960 RepID=A0A2T4UJZ8_9ACTN|nr:SDR family oxidoreductase [Paraconexibacter algicola]PTL59572.1 2,4-dienoyl-CoA reductase [Paraconexibacter algicola]
MSSPNTTGAGRYTTVFRDGLFDGQVIVVTGGGSGIGRCTAHELCRLGASVALIGRRVERLEAVRGELAVHGGEASVHACDIRDEDAVRASVAAVRAEHGRIDGLVNNAGGQFPAPLEKISANGWDAVVRTNLTGGFLMAREVYSQQLHATGGSIVNIIADIWGGMPTMGHSGAARAGMLNLTETAACEWAAAGVRVNAVAPGWIASSGFDTYDEAMQAELRRLKDKVPLGRYGTEAEVSAAIVFLLSPAAAFISGSCVRVDGAVPNNRHTWNGPVSTRSVPFDGFPLATMPTALREYGSDDS